MIKNIFKREFKKIELHFKFLILIGCFTGKISLYCITLKDEKTISAYIFK